MAPSDIPSAAPSPFSPSDYQLNQLPDHDDNFVTETDISAFAKALEAPDEFAKSPELSPDKRGPIQFITALNDWRPIRQRVRKDQAKPRRKKRKRIRRGKDETREGFVYTLLKWPLLLFVLMWIVCLAWSYAATRLYIWAYERGVAMRGRREALRKKLYEAKSYDEWVDAARQIDRYLGNDRWKETEEYAYYNSGTINTVRDQLRRLRTSLEQCSRTRPEDKVRGQVLADELRAILEASIKDNFVGVENARLYSETYYGTKNLVQSFLEEASASLHLLSRSSSYLSSPVKSNTFTHLSANYGRTALCLSGGASFAYYHFGIAKALLDAEVLPNIITGTSGGALVAALLATRTDAELRTLLVPALAHRINACREPITTTTRRWWRTGAQFDSIDWARRCAWFTRGSLTFLEAYQRTGRILNITCIPSDPHSPAVLANYLTSPDCVIWSAVLASAAVPGILNPVVLMRKNAHTGQLEPYSFGHKWKDGSLRTDIPLKALNTHFNVTYSIVSQVNPHINLFFFSSRGTVGRPVTHRRGRGWRGGFLGSATEQYLKLDLTKWLKVIRHLELLPRYAEQDWSNIWLQRFDGTITIWPRTRASDFWHILSDPSSERLARMLWAGMQSAWPKIKFVQNRMLIERAIADGLKKSTGDTDLQRLRMGITDRDANDSVSSPSSIAKSDFDSAFPQHFQEEEDDDDLERSKNGASQYFPQQDEVNAATSARETNPAVTQRFTKWWPASSQLRVHSPTRQAKRHSWTPTSTPLTIPSTQTEPVTHAATHSAGSTRRGSIITELSRQSRVFIDDIEPGDDGTGSEDVSEEDHSDVSDRDEAIESTRGPDESHEEGAWYPTRADGEGLRDVVERVE